MQLIVQANVTGELIAEAIIDGSWTKEEIARSVDQDLKRIAFPDRSEIDQTTLFVCVAKRPVHTELFRQGVLPLNKDGPMTVLLHEHPSAN